MVALILACKLPPAEEVPPPTWVADCNGWSCPDASYVSMSEHVVYCLWECTSWEDDDGVDLLITLRADYDGCWEHVATAAHQVDCTWINY